MSELGELYVSMTLKTLSLSMISVFVPIYLYDLGISLAGISLYFFLYFVVRTPINVVAGVLVARYGPKHVLSYGYVITLVYLGMLLTLPQYDWSLWALSLVAAISNSFFFVAYHVDFSKIKIAKKEGEELSRMYLLVRIAGAIGPLFGGLMATLLGTDAAMITAIIVMLLAIVPLMMTSEPVAKSSKMPDFSSFNVKKEGRNIIAYSMIGVSRQAALSVWPLYIALFVFSENVYGLVGLVTSVSVVASILAAKMFGNIIDDRKGAALLNYGAIFVTVIHAARTTISTLWGVIGVNILSDIGETAVILPLTKGFYDDADSRRSRIVYVTMMEVFVAIPRAVFWLLLAVLFHNLDPQFVLETALIICALVTPVVMIHNFSALKPAGELKNVA